MLPVELWYPLIVFVTLTGGPVGGGGGLEGGVGSRLLLPFCLLPGWLEGGMGARLLLPEWLEEGVGARLLLPGCLEEGVGARLLLPG